MDADAQLLSRKWVQKLRSSLLSPIHLFLASSFNGFTRS
jgi:hypothetical protein